MEKIQSLSNSILRGLKGHMKDETDAQKEAWITNVISYWLDDAFKLIKNIDQTSLNDTDRFKRIIEIEEKFGIPKTHLIK